MISGEDSSQVSHPPHLIFTWSSAFIPFCAFKTDLNFSENTLALPGITFPFFFFFLFARYNLPFFSFLFLPGITFPLCSSFLPTILEGQLCYKLTLNMTSGQGKENQLMLLLDYHEDRTLQTSSFKIQDEVTDRIQEHVDDGQFSKRTMNFGTAVHGIQGVSAKIQINTLSPYVRFGGGTFTMTAVKRMTAKDGFLKMPLKDRNCNTDLYEDCRTRKLLQECNCVPWEVPGFKVKN